MGMCIDSDFSILPLYFQLCEKWVFISKFGVVSAIAVLRPLRLWSLRKWPFSAIWDYQYIHSKYTVEYFLMHKNVDIDTFMKDNTHSY